MGRIVVVEVECAGGYWRSSWSVSGAVIVDCYYCMADSDRPPSTIVFRRISQNGQLECAVTSA